VRTLYRAVREREGTCSLVTDEHQGCITGGTCIVSCWAAVRCHEAVCCGSVTKVLISCRSLSGKDEWVWQVFDRVADLCRSHVIRLRVQQVQGEGNMAAM
jgi:hypothetical protein